MSARSPRRETATVTIASIAQDAAHGLARRSRTPRSKRLVADGLTATDGGSPPRPLNLVLRRCLLSAAIAARVRSTASRATMVRRGSQCLRVPLPSHSARRSSVSTRHRGSVQANNCSGGQGRRGAQPRVVRSQGLSKHEGYVDGELNKFLQGGIVVGTGLSMGTSRSASFTPARLAHFGLPVTKSPTHPRLLRG